MCLRRYEKCGVLGLGTTVLDHYTTAKHMCFLMRLTSSGHLYYESFCIKKKATPLFHMSLKHRTRKWLVPFRCVVSLYVWAMACSEMAEASVLAEQFSCSVCLDLLKDSVTIPCGHSYCMSCITDHWNQEDQKRVYSCPQCRQTFRPRPALGKNTMLAEVVEELKKTELQSEDVECDVCTERKQKAVKSCLVCLNSYCQNHLEQHENFFKGKRHNLMDATGRLQEMICQKHDKLLEIYCHTDHRCICLLCMVDEHKNHSTVSTAAGRAEKQVHTERHWCADSLSC